MPNARVGAYVSKKYDDTTRHRRADRHETVSAQDKTVLADTCVAGAVAPGPGSSITCST
jgi:hypothetical protein